MCTCISFCQEDHYFGRNLDLEYHFAEQVLLTPRHFPLELPHETTQTTHYAMIGMASAAAPFPLYAEAINEKGLSMAGLYFPQNACYFPRQENKGRGIAPYGFIPWVLGQCETIDQARALLADVYLTEKSFGPNFPVATLHWMVADKTGAFVVEQQADGFHLYDNPVGVLTNNPPFPFQLENLRQYLHLSPNVPKNSFSPHLSLTPFGEGFGAIGLPGDWSPASRFVKTAFLLQNSIWGDTEESRITQAFHLLDQVSMVKGAVWTEHGKADETIYSCIANASQGIYYVTNYENRRIQAISLWDGDLESDQLQRVPLETTQDVQRVAIKK